MDPVCIVSPASPIDQMPPDISKASAWRLVSPRSLTARSPTSVGSDRKRPKSHHTTIFTKAKVDEYDARSCHGRMRKFVEDKMDMLIGAVIVINVIFVWIELEVTGHEA